MSIDFENINAFLIFLSIIKVFKSSEVSIDYTDASFDISSNWKANTYVFFFII